MAVLTTPVHARNLMHKEAYGRYFGGDRRNQNHTFGSCPVLSLFFFGWWFGVRSLACAIQSPLAQNEGVCVDLPDLCGTRSV